MAASLLLDLADQAATERLAGRLATLLAPGDAVLLQGPIGAGKSTLVRALLRAAAGDPALEVPSPSFTLVQSYDLPRWRAHHFDLWRLDGASALQELGWTEAAADVVLVEWPERLGGLTPADALTIRLEPSGDASRRAVLAGWTDRLGALA